MNCSSMTKLHRWLLHEEVQVCFLWNLWTELLSVHTCILCPAVCRSVLISDWSTRLLLTRAWWSISSSHQSSNGCWTSFIVTKNPQWGGTDGTIGERANQEFCFELDCIFHTHPIADGAPSPAPCEAPHSLFFESTVTRDCTTMKMLVLESAWVWWEECSDIRMLSNQNILMSAGGLKWSVLVMTTAQQLLLLRPSLGWCCFRALSKALPRCHVWSIATVHHSQPCLFGEVACCFGLLCNARLLLGCNHGSSTYFQPIP